MIKHDIFDEIIYDATVKRACALGKHATNSSIWRKVNIITEMIKLICDDFHFIVTISKHKKDKFIRFIDTLYNNTARWIRESKEKMTEQQFVKEIVEKLEHQCAVFCKQYEEWSYPDWKNKNKEMIAAYYNLDENIMNNISSYMFY